MSYFCLIQAVVSYLENRLKTEIDYQSLAKVTGFSLPHARYETARAAMLKFFPT